MLCWTRCTYLQLYIAILIVYEGNHRRDQSRGQQLLVCERQHSCEELRHQYTHGSSRIANHISQNGDNQLSVV